MIQTRFQVSDLPDAFVFLPENLGGLGLRNPFVNLFLIRDSIDKSPEEIIDRLLRTERDRYIADKKAFEATGESVLRRRLRSIFPDLDDDDSDSLGIKSDEAEIFMSLDEYTRKRERHGAEYRDIYKELISTPEIKEVALSKEVESSLGELDGAAAVLDAEKKWFLQLYSEELLEDFGGLSLVDKQFLPVGVLAMMRGRKITWQMVL